MAITSVNGTLANGNQAWGPNDEIDRCSYNADRGARTRSRPQIFCESVTIGGSLSVASGASFSSSVSIGGSLSTGSPVVVNGIPMVPITIVTSGGTYTVLGVAGGDELGFEG